MKEGWKYMKLGEVCEIERGGSPRPIKDFITTAPDGLNWIKIGDTDPQGKYIYSTKEKIKPTGLKKTRWVEVDDFLLSNSMSFGRPYILKTNGCIHDGWLVLRKYQQYLNADFFYYLLLSSRVQKQFQQKAQGSTVSNLNTQRVSGVEIAFPPLPDQQRIVTYLDAEFAKIEALKANAEKQLQAAKDLFQAALKELLTPKEGWKMKTIDSLQTDMYRGSGITREQIRLEGVPCVRYGEIYTTYNYWFEECVSHTDEQIINSKKYFEHGDILFAITGESVEDIGKSIAYLGHNKCLAGGDIIVMKHNQNPKYLAYALSTPDAIAQKGFGKTKLKVVHTNAPSLKAIVLPIPTLPEQQRIADRLDALSANVKALQTNYTETITLCNDLKQALLKQVFG